jgi:hypothetical protein
VTNRPHAGAVIADKSVVARKATSMADRRSRLTSKWPTLALAVIVLAVLFWQQGGQPRPPQHVPTDAGGVAAPSDYRADGREGDRFSLREIPGNAFESPAGLVYESGGPDGHRIDHILRHADDDLTKPVHGVFHGNRQTILALIDEAYLLTRKRGPPGVRQERQRDRTVYTVDLQREIGYLGGQAGRRRKHPSLRHVRLVFEDRDVITAYPVEP